MPLSVDIQVIPTDDLLKELDRRFPRGLVMAANLNKEHDVEERDHWTHFGEGSFTEMVKLSTFLLWRCQISFNENCLD